MEPACSAKSKNLSGFTLIDHHAAKRGFTLIELSIVLVIIGLVTASILVAQDLIAAATVRAQIAQIEKYNTAANTFKAKYGHLPGDITATAASQYGFTARGAYPGEGDGNGIIESNVALNMASDPADPENLEGQTQAMGETALFWMDLSAAHLVEGSFTTANATQYNSSFSDPSLYFPKARSGRKNYVYVWSGGPAAQGTSNHNGINYFGVVGGYSFDFQGSIQSTPALTVAEAYAMDKKIDDGLPQSGRVTAMYASATGGWWGTWAGGVWSGASWSSGTAGASDGANNPTTAATAGSSTTCYDNNNTAGPQRYSMEQNKGQSLVCALSFQFQ